MTIIRYLPLLLFLAVLSSCRTQQINVIKVGDSTTVSANDGIFYSLPRTQFNIEVTVTKVEEVKGPYSEFAGKYLGLTNVITQNNTSYSLGEIKITTTPVPDPSQYYFVELTGKWGKRTGNLLISLSESGMIQNTTGSPQTEKETGSLTSQTEENKVYPDIFKYFSDLNLFEKVDTIIEKVNVDTATIEKMTFRHTLVEKTPEQKAKDAADFIMKVKDNRFNLVSGFQEVNYGEETFTAMNREMENLEADYQKLFTGLTFTKTLTYNFKYIPDALHSADSVTLCKFSHLRGILNASDLNGDLLYLKINRSKDTYPLTTYLRHKPTSKDSHHGIYYCIPEYANISVLTANKLRTSGKFLVSQYGVISWLPPYKTGIELYPSTGALQKIGIK